MSHVVKLTLFVLAFKIIGFAEAYLLSDLGLVWLLPILIVTASGGVSLSWSTDVWRGDERIWGKPQGGLEPPKPSLRFA